VRAQDGPRVTGGFTERDCLQARSLETEGESADTAEQVKDAHKSDLGENT
jgi:hypothetical protein